MNRVCKHMEARVAFSPAKPSLVSRKMSGFGPRQHWPRAGMLRRKCAAALSAFRRTCQHLHPVLRTLQRLATSCFSRAPRLSTMPPDVASKVKKLSLFFNEAALQPERKNNLSLYPDSLIGRYTTAICQALTLHAVLPSSPHFDTPHSSKGTSPPLCF